MQKIVTDPEISNQLNIPMNYSIEPIIFHKECSLIESNF